MTEVAAQFEDAHARVRSPDLFENARGAVRGAVVNVIDEEAIRESIDRLAQQPVKYRKGLRFVIKRDDDANTARAGG